MYGHYHLSLLPISVGNPYECSLLWGRWVWGKEHQSAPRNPVRRGLGYPKAPGPVPPRVTSFKLKQCSYNPRTAVEYTLRFQGFSAW